MSLLDLNIALNEADVVAVKFSEKLNKFAILLSPIRADQTGNIPADNLLKMIFSPVHRIAVSCRDGRWDDNKADVIPLDPQEFADNVRTHGRFPIYNGDFIDNDNTFFRKYEDRLSFDFKNPLDQLGKHSFEFARDTDQFMIVKVWFDDVKLFDSTDTEINMDDFVADAKRAWADPKILNQFGIYLPLS